MAVRALLFMCISAAVQCVEENSLLDADEIVEPSDSLSLIQTAQYLTPTNVATDAKPDSSLEKGIEQSSSKNRLIGVIYIVAALTISVWAVKHTAKDTYMTTITVLIVIAHTGVHMMFEGWCFTTSIYVGAQVATTIGYGDITPSSTAGRLITMICILWTLVMVSYLLNKLVASIVSSDAPVTMKAWRKATALFVGSVAFGTVLFATLENCSCSYGLTAAPAKCLDTTYSECVDSGGYVKTWFDAMYLSVMTLTTVGFGDFSPVTATGRFVGVFWMFIGVAITGNWIMSTTSMMFAHAEEEQPKSSSEIFKLLDTDNDGCLNQLQTYMFQLMKDGTLSEEKLQELSKDFTDVQKTPRGLVTHEALQKKDLTPR